MNIVMQPDPKYFDYAASSPPFDEALSTYRTVAGRYYGNPSSLHRSGAHGREKYLELKNQLCDLVSFREGRFLLCSSGSEANNTIIEGHLQQFPDSRLLIAEHAHDSVWYAVNRHRDRADVLKINGDGYVDLEVLKKARNAKTSLVCLSHVCNETGVIQPLQAIAEYCTYHGIHLMVDGSQAIGHIPVVLDHLACSYYTFSAHKFGAPRGTGGIFFRDDQFKPLILGGRQEWSLRAGTENIAGLASAVEALRQSLAMMRDEDARLNSFTKKFIDELKSNIPGVVFQKHENSAPGFISLCIPGRSGSEMVAALSLSGFSVSTGSACHANEVAPSRVLLAIGRSKEEATGALRITMGRGTTESSVGELVKLLVETAQL